MDVTKNVPIPERKGGRPKRKYPFDEMSVGDSLSFNDEETFQKARRAAQTYTRRYGALFTSRRGWQDGKFTDIGGTMWRVE